MKQSDPGGVIGIGGAEFISCVAIGFEKCFVWHIMVMWRIIGGICSVTVIPGWQVVYAECWGQQDMFMVQCWWVDELMVWGWLYWNYGSSARLSSHRGIHLLRGLHGFDLCSLRGLMEWMLLHCVGWWYWLKWWFCSRLVVGEWISDRKLGSYILIVEKYGSFGIWWLKLRVYVAQYWKQWKQVVAGAR